MDRIVCPDDWVPVTLGGGTVDLRTLSAAGRNAGALLPTGSGTVTVTTAGSGATQRTLPVTGGNTLLGEFTSVVSVSGPTALHAAFP